MLHGRLVDAGCDLSDEDLFFLGGPASTLYRCWREIGHGVDLALGTSYRGMRVFGFCYATSSRCTEGSDSKLKEVIDLFFFLFL